MGKLNNKTREQLIEEINKLRTKFSELKSLEKEHLKTLEALKETEERYKGIIKSTASCVVVYKSFNNGEDFIITEFNSMAEEVEQISKEKVIGKKVTKAFPGVKEFGLFKVFQNVWKTGKSEHFPVSVYQDERIQGYRENYIYKLSTGEIVTVYQDLTESKKIENSLKIQRKNFTDILKGTNAGTWEWNIPTGELTLNERWAEIMGYTLKELEPIDINTWIDNVHPDDLPIANAQLDKHFNRELDYYDVVFRQPHKNGKWVWVNARGRVTEWAEDGKPLRISGTHLNITERKEAEEELGKHREHLEELVRERTKELEDKNKELDNALLVFVGREQTIKDLEERVRALGGR
ncbi:MAG: PAS domain-containing protein [Bacteroidales bacterium]|nr:PAS domain-containing protein [Bacteroidales bacterium]